MAGLGLVGFVARLPFYGCLNHVVQEIRYRQWTSLGRPSPPPHKVKQQVLKELADRHGLSVLVETGTLFGDMVYALRDHFAEIYSIEVFEPLFRQAENRFRRMGHVKLLKGDSGVVLGQLVRELKGPTLFWLDGHYSGAGTGQGEGVTPIYKELDAVFAMDAPMAVAIDDARLFGVDPGYPSMDELNAFVRAKDQQVDIRVENDIIQITRVGSRA